MYDFYCASEQKVTRAEYQEIYDKIDKLMAKDECAGEFLRQELYKLDNVGKLCVVSNLKRLSLNSIVQLN